MSERKLQFFMIMLLMVVFSTPGSAKKSKGSDDYVSLGVLKTYWRYAPALGPYHEIGGAMVEIPDYLTTGDFAYKKRNETREVPFADHLTLVRFLGGFMNVKDPDSHLRDLAYRDKKGKIQYRMELLEPRLRPYLDAGHDSFTVVLDNVPSCFTEEPRFDKMGQAMPPKDPQEWYDFIVEVCNEIKRVMGNEASNKLRFRVGTEMQDERRFDGDQDQFIEFYNASLAAVKSVLPEAKVGFFNVAGVSIRGIIKGHNVNTFDLVTDCLKKRNKFSKSRNGAPDWIAFSRYYSVREDAAVKARVAAEVWDEVEKQNPKVTGISREIHEFGVVPFGKGFVTSEYGALGAAQTAQMMFCLQREGIDRIFHWSMGDRFKDGSNQLHHLFTSYAWLLSVMDRCIGGESYLLNPVTASDDGPSFVGMASVKSDETIVILTAYDKELLDGESQEVSFKLPLESIQHLLSKQKNSKRKRCSVKYVKLDTHNSAHDIIRRDLTAKGLLNEKYDAHPARLDTIRKMAIGREGESYIGDQLDKYKQVWTESLTLKKASMGDVQLIKGKDYFRIKTDLKAPELLVLVISKG